MKIVEKICKEWNSICRVFNIKENPLTYSHKDLLEFAEYYHNSQLNNDVALDIVMLSYIKKLCKEYNKKPEQIVLNIDDESKTIDAYFVDNKSKIYHLDSKTYN